MAKKPTTPIKVTLKLLDGRICSTDGIIMLDAILYHAWFAKYAPHVLDGIYTDERSNIGLPLRQLEGNRWAASKGIYIEIGNNIEYLNKRFNFLDADKIDKLDMAKGVISSSKGTYRAYRMPKVVRIAKDATVTFYAMGHTDEVSDYLSYIPAVGKKPACGYGFVTDWNVEECDNDYSLWHPEYGLMRPVEVGSEEAARLDLHQYPIMKYAVKPPYWKTENMRLCYVPIGGHANEY